MAAGDRATTCVEVAATGLAAMRHAVRPLDSRCRPALHRARRLGAIAFLAAVLPSAALAQPSFSEVTPHDDGWFSTPPEDDFWVVSAAPADVDADGDLDLAVLGFYVVYDVSVEDRLTILRNDGAGANGRWSFTAEAVALGPQGAGASDLAWGDVDGDGDPDLAVGSNGATAIYRNDAGTLKAVDSALPGYYEDSEYDSAYDLRSITWGDIDNDGDLDLLLPSIWEPETFSMRTALMRNDGVDPGGAPVFTEIAASLDPTVHAQSAWIDDDHDGDLDLMLCNIDPWLDTGFLRRYGNEAGTWTGADQVDIAVQYGACEWGDADGDGDLDVLVAGNIREADGSYDTVLRIYEREGATFLPRPLPLPAPGWLDLHAASWADYDSDGDVDLLVTGAYVGAGEIVGGAEIYTRGADGAFTPLGVALPAPISSIGRGGAFVWFDVDGDADLDYLTAGAYYVPGGNGLVESRMQLFRNVTAAANTAPTAAQQVTAVPGTDSVQFSWQPALDDGTPAAAITYELEVRPLGAAPADALRLPEPGRLGSGTSWSLRGLAPGDYAWSLRAVDNAWAAGPPATGSVRIGNADAVFENGFE